MGNILLLGVWSLNRSHLYAQLEHVRKTMNILWDIKTVVDAKFLCVATQFDSLLNEYNRIGEINGDTRINT